MDGRFTIMEDMLKKLLEVKPNSMTSEAKETTGSHERGGNHKISREGENPEVEILEGDEMPPLEPLSRKEISIMYEWRGVEFVRRGEDFDRRGADFERRGDFEGLWFERRTEERDTWGAPPF
ncbi:hypothetical protein M5K25_008140 [Dendrobium thyrsiflorum]|uniref:Uncharacterized protein n=1 Tax=Dendrobium thyrsiflorum TaxID=117978 RepID=A0ABD0V7Z0_DENTH